MTIITLLLLKYKSIYKCKSMYLFQVSAKYTVRMWYQKVSVYSRKWSTVFENINDNINVSPKLAHTYVENLIMHTCSQIVAKYYSWCFNSLTVFVTWRNSIVLKWIYDVKRKLIWGSNLSRESTLTSCVSIITNTARQPRESYQLVMIRNVRIIFKGKSTAASDGPAVKTWTQNLLKQLSVFYPLLHQDPNTIPHDKMPSFWCHRCKLMQDSSNSCFPT